MPQYADETPEATQAAKRQAARLKLLRRLIVHSQLEAAKAAGVSKDVWNRMEKGHHRIGALTLAAFGRAYGVPMEFVLSGRTDGLPPALVERLTLARLDEEQKSGVSLVEPDPLQPGLAPAPGPQPWSNPARKARQLEHS